MAKKILAVSGGIDSMVMLDMLYNSGQFFVDDYLESELVVAHFNHGTRKSASADAEFVSKMATEKYRIFSCGASAELGENVSEEKARECRYDFLRYTASRFPTTQKIKLTGGGDSNLRAGREAEMTKICTAHHLNDLVESVVINLIRGTGWRGLAVLDARGVQRPFLEPEVFGLGGPWGKKDILRYAARHGVSFRQDPTNTSENYLRNRVRERLRDFDKSMEIYKLWRKQKKLKAEIDELVWSLLPANGEAWKRSWFEDLDEKVALEFLRAGTLRAGVSATRPQLENFRQAILTYSSGKSFNLPGDKLVRFRKNEFYLE